MPIVYDAKYLVYPNIASILATSYQLFGSMIQTLFESDTFPYVERIALFVHL